MFKFATCTEAALSLLKVLTDGHFGFGETLKLSFMSNCSSYADYDV
jgi:hypothetical protein